MTMHDIPPTTTTTFYGYYDDDGDDCYYDGNMYRDKSYGSYSTSYYHDFDERNK